ncbi:hypothetical protein BS50DRAFT_588900 [Corynespora cassiicola Philippines]|uniref:Small ribosomal subunit protein mS38 n=1 Tax=Corynespora cassiicola Philippines TaxID=1448308 RepID=A0A2T2NL34_CORCC|nr:hypothetical protein BS50DRAFT_588900 [Corynespora cassiicola Philippines]
MFSPAIGRAVRSSGSIPTPSVSALGRPITLGAAQQSFSRPTHQRRLSSSKPSTPPDGSNTKGSRSADQSASKGSSSSDKSASTSTTNAPAGNARRTRSSAPAATPAPPTLNVPHVPPTDHLQKAEVRASSFFSLYRPLSTNSVIPPVSTNASFDSIFKVRGPNDRNAMRENIQTMAGGIESLESLMRGHESSSSGQAVQMEAEVHHLDGAPEATLDDMMRRLLPFNPPPVPQPFDQAAASETASNELADDTSAAATPVSRRMWRTEVLVAESTFASGKRTYSATTAPMIEIEAPAGENGQEVEDVVIRQPFLERMRQRQLKKRPSMQAISVKRQRKLKMKKHKYKKLMKRTRLERRKLDRA